MTKFGKLTIFGIIIALLMVAGFSIWFFNPDQKEKLEIKKTIKSQEVQKEQVEHTIDGIPFYSDFYRPLTPQGKSCVSRVLGDKKLDEINGGLPSAYLTREKIVALKNCAEIFPPMTDEDRAELLENCANAEIPLTGERNTVYNSEKKTLEVSFWNEELQEDVRVMLPYEPETDFAGCSDSAKDILRHIQELNEENIRSGKE